MTHHIDMLESILEDPVCDRVCFDISWDEVAKYVLSSPEATQRTAHMINRYPDRFLFGTDNVAPPDSASRGAIPHALFQRGVVRPHRRCLVWLVFQLYIILYPMHPMIQRPVHVFLAVIATALFRPLAERGFRLVLDWLMIGASIATMGYYLAVSTRLVERMENVDPVLPHDILFGTVAVLLILEATRRVIGWSLLGRCHHDGGRGQRQPRLGRTGHADGRESRDRR